MPSAANVKIDKQISPENPLTDPSGNSNSPIRQAITVIEHKIRNLEKRKSKLESYKELQNAGKELNADQKTAVAKFNEVLQTLDFARDLCKQFLGIATGSEKEAKKQQKKEAAAKNQMELARLREILLVQDALNQMGTENVREDFLHGRNGAAQLSETDIKLLDDLYPAVTPKHEAGNPTAFTNEVQAAAEHLLAVVDGKQKEVYGGTYSQVKDILGRIHESGYFDQAQIFEGYVETTAVEEPEQPQIVTEQILTPEIIQEPQQQVLPVPQATVLETLTNEVRNNAIHMTEHQAVDASAGLVQQPPTISAEQAVFYQQQPPVPPQPLRPLTEMLGTGNFFFLQDSEIDPPPTEQQSIPSQTFTNQNYVSGGPPAPPIQLPPHFQGMPQPPPNLQAPVNPIIDEAVIVEQQKQVKKPIEEIHKTIPSGGGGGGSAAGLNHQPAQRPPMQQMHRVNNSNNSNAAHQSYYQNNNGYSNTHRPRQQQRNAPNRSGNNNRH